MIENRGAFALVAVAVGGAAVIERERVAIATLPMWLNLDRSPTLRSRPVLSYE